MVPVLQQVAVVHVAAGKAVKAVWMRTWNAETDSPSTPPPFTRRQPGLRRLEVIVVAGGSWRLLLRGPEFAQSLHQADLRLIATGCQLRHRSAEVLGLGREEPGRVGIQARLTQDRPQGLHRRTQMDDEVGQAARSTPQMEGLKRTGWR